MKGATAVPCVRNTKEPNMKRIKIMGYNQNFFLFIRNLKNSFKKSILKLIFKVYFILKPINPVRVSFTFFFFEKIHIK